MYSNIEYRFRLKCTTYVRCAICVKGKYVYNVQLHISRAGRTFVCAQYPQIHSVDRRAYKSSAYWIYFIRKISFADATPQRNKFYQSSADGCGSLGMKIDTEYLPAVEMENCCNAHDICYDTCNKDKELCDLDFKRCLYNYCETHAETATVGSLVTKGCKAAAKLLSTGTLTLGCKSYLDSQERSCYCPGQQQQQQQGSSERSTGGGYKKRPKYTNDYARN